MRKLFTSESVTEGHPDKVCDLISDSILDAYLEQDENSRVACETVASKGEIIVTGEITSNGIVDIDSWPLIPTYLEIEGKDEKSVLDMIEKLELDKSKVTSLDVQSVYEKFYNIDISKIKDLRF